MDGGTQPHLEPLALPERLACAEAAPAPDWGRMAMVPVGALAVDRSWQRELDRAGWRLVEQIAGGFDPVAFGILQGYWSGARFVLIDGQHRALAAMALGLSAVPAYEIRPESAARSFMAINKARRPLSRPAEFHARLAAGDPAVAEIAAAVAAAGLTIPRYVKAQMPGEVTCVALLEREWAARPAALGLALEMLADAERAADLADDKRSAVLKGPAVRAATEVIAAILALPDEEGVAGIDGLAALWSQCLPTDQLDEARDLAARHGGALWQHLARVIARELAEAGGPDLALGVD